MAQATRVQRLRVREPAVAVAHVKQQVARWLDAQTPARLGLPTDAIVVLRSVRAPWSALHPDSPTDVLGAKLRRAARPAWGAPLGTGCDAVWFADEAELLACLAHDHLQGQLGHRWWWQTWLGRRPGDEAALQAWLTSARTAPAAMVRLHAMGAGLAWARHIGAGGRQALLQAMWPHQPIAQAAAAWLPHALAGSKAVREQQGPWPPIAPAPSDDATDDPRVARTPHPDHTDTWAAWGELDGASVWVALCTLLHEAPHLALDERRLADRLQSAAGPRDAAGTPQPSHDAQTPGQSMPPADLPLCPAPAASSPIDRHASHHGQPVRVSHAELDTRCEAPTHGSPPAPWPHPARRRSTVAPGEPTSPARSADPATSRASQPTQPPRPTTPLPPSPLQVTPTSHGGVVFLLKVALAGVLYGDFTRPRHALLSVSPWQFLHASGFALLGRAFAADPLAGWLRAQAPFSRPRPASALGGTPLSLLPGNEASGLRSANGLAMLAPRSARPDDELRAWWPLLRRRLSLALNLPEREAIATCLNLSARIERRGDRVDVCFPLHQLPLAIRLAGLDRDPGWVPASGCDIRLHFEA